MKKTLLSVIAFLFLFAIVACSNDSSNSTNTNSNENETKNENTEAPKQTQDTVSIVMWSAPDTFNPYFSQGNYGKYAGGELVLDTLLDYDPEYNFIPGLAKDYKVSDDGLEYTIILDENATWHDGEPFTADDVAFTLKSIMDPEWTGTGYVSLALVKGAQDYKDGKADDVPGIEVVDEHTIKITLNTPYAPFLEAVGKGLWILPEHAFENVNVADIATADFSKNPVGTGPVKFVKYATDQYVEYDANENYFLGAPEFKKLILRIMTPDLALAAFEAGEIHATTRTGIGTINISDHQKIQELDNVEVTVFDTMSYQTMTVNTTKDYLSDKRVRQAIMHGIDRVAIVEQLLQGKGKVAYGPIAEESPWFNDDLPSYDHDPEKAKQLLEEAGWDFNRTVTLSVPKGNIIRERSAPLIQQYLQAIGMKVELEYMDFPTLMELMEKQELDMALLGTSTGMVDPDSNIYPFFHSSQFRPAGWNTASFTDSHLDELLEAGAIETDQERRKEIYDEVQSIVADELPYIYLYYEQSIGAVSKELKNAVPNQVGIEWNIYDWSFNE
ncbi:ABC transporter substrate-binding protein [Ferdinandcohnia sp. SAFN-114]|uniref:ABC transporter substrate-binding protein n=1 Tax=Ferdinandcohnia sp. SAFN-114 TaxID=3387275 RepID=UPI003F812E39